jgi:hypothetical protein
MTTAPQLSIVTHGSGWRVASASIPGAFHFVSRTPHLRCTCPAWVYGHGALCKHLKLVMEQEKEVTMG